MNERIYVFGRNNHLVGIITEPAADPLRKHAPALILLNAGLIHRVGPLRFYVDFARLLAQKGYTVLRVDLSGIGDSQQSVDNRPEHDRIMNDISDSMDIIEAKRGIKSFILCGLCWGADMSHDCAVVDPRVAGAVFLDTYGYPTFGFFLHDRVFPLFNLSKWVQFIQKKMSGIFSAPGSVTVKKTPNIFNRQFPPKEKVVSEINNLIARKTKLLYIYSGGVPVYYNHAGQFWEMFKKIDFHGCVEAAYFKEADHIFSQLALRRRMFDCIIRWMEKNFPNNTL